MRPAQNQSQWESSPRTLAKVLLALFLVLAALGYLAYRFGAPIVADWLAAAALEGLVSAVSDQTLATLERDALEPTALTKERQAQISGAFVQAVGARGGYRLVFASSPALGPNAAALPSGIIIITDDLVRLARDDREIVGVLAHEAGHVEGRHGLRLLVRAFAFDTMVGLLFGDYSGVAAAASSMLVQARYSRDFEREADVFAAASLRARGIAPSVLADILGRLEQDGLGRRKGPRPPLLDYVNSHPATAERMAYLRGATPP
jgi:Zn-dependent protease with chaperone function